MTIQMPRFKLRNNEQGPFLLKVLFFKWEKKTYMSFGYVCYCRGKIGFLIIPIKINCFSFFLCIFQKEVVQFSEMLYFFHLDDTYCLPSSSVCTSLCQPFRISCPDLIPHTVCQFPLILKCSRAYKTQLAFLNTFFPPNLWSIVALFKEKSSLVIKSLNG